MGVDGRLGRDGHSSQTGQFSINIGKTGHQCDMRHVAAAGKGGYGQSVQTGHFSQGTTGGGRRCERSAQLDECSKGASRAFFNRRTPTTPNRRCLGHEEKARCKQAVDVKRTFASIR